MIGRDFVNVSKPSAASFWLNRNGNHLRFMAGLLALAIIGSLGVQ